MSRSVSLATILSLFILQTGFGQQVYIGQNFCHGFDDCPILTYSKGAKDSTADHAFGTRGPNDPYGSACLSDWEVASGTPSLYRSSDGFGNAYDGNQFVLMGVCGDGYPTAQLSDGIVLKYNFQQGARYTVSMALRTTTDINAIDIDYILLKSSLNYPYNYHVGCTTIPAIPDSSLVTLSITGFASSEWQVLSFDIARPDADYTRLWIRAVASQAATVALCIDSVCVRPDISTRISPGSNAAGFELYPNPASDYIHIKSDGDMGSSFTYNILSVNGQQIMCGHATCQDARINTATLPNGVYLIYVKDNSPLFPGGMGRFEVIH